MWKLVAGILIVMINGYWFYLNLNIFWIDINDEMSPLVPEWVLTYNFIFSLIGMVLGVQVIREKTTIQMGVVATLLLMVIGYFIELLSN